MLEYKKKIVNNDLNIIYPIRILLYLNKIIKKIKCNLVKNIHFCNHKKIKNK